MACLGFTFTVCDWAVSRLAHLVQCPATQVLLDVRCGCLKQLSDLDGLPGLQICMRVGGCHRQPYLAVSSACSAEYSSTCDVHQLV